MCILASISVKDGPGFYTLFPLMFTSFNLHYNPSSVTNVVTAAAAKSLQSCLTLRPHRRQPTRLPSPWDSPGKNTGVGCHFLFQCIIVRSESEVTQSCPTLSDPMDCSLPGSSIHGFPGKSTGVGCLLR